MKYIALLRGINISGKNKIAMPELKSAFEQNNYKNVVTFLNSGNVIFECDQTSVQNLMQNIYELIKRQFNLEIPVFVMTDTELEEVLAASPNWWDGADKSIYDNLIFIIPPKTFDEVFNAIGNPSDNIEKIAPYKNYVFWSFDLDNYKKANWWIKTASLPIRDSFTIRTANTMKKVLNLCKK